MWKGVSTKSSQISDTLQISLARVLAMPLGQAYLNIYTCATKICQSHFSGKTQLTAFWLGTTHHVFIPLLIFLWKIELLIEKCEKAIQKSFQVPDSKVYMPIS